MFLSLIECKYRYNVIICDVGYENGTGEWDEYPPYLNTEGLEISSPVSVFCFFFNSYINISVNLL